MTKICASLLGLAVLFFMIGTPRVTQACNGWPNGFGNVHAFGCSGSLYGLGYVPVPPYFALHPPVYYGERYFRSYGGSPFARRAVQPRATRVAAKIILNPHVAQPASQPAAQPESKTGAQAAKTAQAQMIINPFYHADETSVAQIEDAR